MPKKTDLGSGPALPTLDCQPDHSPDPAPPKDHSRIAGEEKSEAALQGHAYKTDLPTPHGFARLLIPTSVPYFLYGGLEPLFCPGLVAIVLIRSDRLGQVSGLIDANAFGNGADRGL